MRVAFALLSGVAAALVASSSGAAVASVGCDQVVGRVRSGTAAGYRVVLGAVSVPPLGLRDVGSGTTPGWPYWAKAGLAIRSGSPPVHVAVAASAARLVQLTWGDAGPAASIGFAGCPRAGGAWNGYAGGFLLRRSAVCVPLVVTVGRRRSIVRVGVSRGCPRG